jgi:diguanylate cyclase (GGDEF)-like protein/PAS domain S-box-containing protein
MIKFPNAFKFETMIAQANIPPHYENDVITSQGERRRVAWNNTMLRDPESGAIIGTASIGEDITERRRAEQALQLHAHVFASATEAILITDAQGKILTTNHAFSQIFGYSQDEIMGKDARFLQSERHDQAFYQQMARALAEVGKWRGELWMRSKEGMLIPTLTSINAVKNSAGELTHYVVLSNDITLLKATEEHLRHLATHDPLTDLPNRSLFFDRLSHALSRAKRSNTRVAVLYLDLDDFKEINDAHGHETGDMVLKAVAQRLRNSLRESDTAARLSGDEFSVLLEDICTNEDAEIVAQNLLRILAQPYVINGHRLSLSASIGITLCSQNCNRPSDLIRRADAAMYRAKQAGKNTYFFYTVPIETQAKET